jgi:hypothetical protein
VHAPVAETLQDEVGNELCHRFSPLGRLASSSGVPCFGLDKPD